MLTHGNTSCCSTTTGAAPQLFASAINLLTAAQCFMPDNSFPYTGDTKNFDFIIVGGGTAGNIVANRLSEKSNWKVLLLEAGLEPPIESDIPYMAEYLRETKYDWNYYTQNDGVNHQSLKNGSMYWPRGKMLGGGSSMNAMFYVRGRDHDFRAWEQTGNPSWNPRNVNLYYKKAESFQNTKLLEDPAIRDTYGRKGPQVINRFNSTYRDLTEKVLDSWDTLGFKQVNDINAEKFRGKGLSGIFTTTAGNGRRYSTFRSYLDPITSRSNLNIVTNAFVTKILIDEDNQAYGVEVDILGKKRTFYASREVIISAGTVNTPQLLMLSGIGPQEHLLSKNIPCFVDLPGVGKNLHDHSNIPIILYGDEPGQVNQKEFLFEVVKYMYNKTGILAQNSFTDISAFYSRNLSMDYPEFQTHVAIEGKNSPTSKLFFLNYRDEVADSFVKFNTKKAMYVLFFNYLHPSSRGSIYLRTSDPFDHPIIEANYFGNDEDLQATADGIQMLTKIVNTPYFKSINAFIHKPNITECNRYKFKSDDYWKCYARSTCMTVYHPVGTSKMGPNPKDAVVNNFLKVHGVKGLRVIDASVMPSVTSGNTNAPTIMIAEMGSDMIKSDYVR